MVVVSAAGEQRAGAHTSVGRVDECLVARVVHGAHGRGADEDGGAWVRLRGAWIGGGRSAQCVTVDDLFGADSGEERAGSRDVCVRARIMRGSPILPDPEGQASRVVLIVGQRTGERLHGGAGRVTPSGNEAAA